MRKTMATLGLTLMLGAGSTSLALAQTGGTGGGTSGGGQGSSYGSTNTGDQGDRGHNNWGWLGLAGLVGLVGLRRRETMGTTRTDTRPAAAR